MRRTLTLCRTGLAGVAAFVLLTACSGDDSGGSAASSSPSETTSSSASETSGGGAAADSEFCQQAADLQTQLQSVSPDLNDPAGAADAIQQVADSVRQIEPPQEIATDWAALADGLDQLVQIFNTTNFNDQQAAAAAQQQVTQIATDLSGASTNVTTYLQNECGLDTGDTASPTS